MESITPKELRDKIANKEDIVIIDVREPFEHEAFNIGGTLIPLNTVFENIALITKDKPVIFYCQKGIRSQIAIQRLQQKFNYTNLINLSGGMEAWKRCKM
jgi:adenylyltransferase/sulfurtransferase